MSEAQDTVDAITAQLGKAKGEVVARIDDLEAQVAAGQAPDFTALRAAAQGLDDVVADAPVVVDPTPVDPPVDVPPTDTPVDEPPAIVE